MKKALIVLILVALFAGCDIQRMWTYGGQHGPGDYRIDIIGTGRAMGYVDGEPGMDGLPKWRQNIGPVDVSGMATVMDIPNTAATYRIGIERGSGSVTIRVRKLDKVISEHHNVEAMVVGRF